MDKKRCQCLCKLKEVLTCAVNQKTYLYMYPQHGNIKISTHQVTNAFTAGDQQKKLTFLRCARRHPDPRHCVYIDRNGKSQRNQRRVVSAIYSQHFSCAVYPRIATTAFWHGQKELRPQLSIQSKFHNSRAVNQTILRQAPLGHIPGGALFVHSTIFDTTGN